MPCIGLRRCMCDVSHCLSGNAQREEKRTFKEDGLVKKINFRRLLKKVEIRLPIPRNIAIAGAEGSIRSVRRNDEACSVTRIFIPLQGRRPLIETLSLTGTLSVSGGSGFLRNRQGIELQYRRGLVKNIVLAYQVGKSSCWRLAIFAGSRRCDHERGIDLRRRRRRY